MDDAAVRMPALARQVQRLGLLVERHPHFDEPLDGARGVFDDELDRLAPVQSAARDHRVLDVIFEGVARVEHRGNPALRRSEEHTSELQSLMRISYAVFCLKKKKKDKRTINQSTPCIITDLTATTDIRLCSSPRPLVHT